MKPLLGTASVSLVKRCRGDGKAGKAASPLKTEAGVQARGHKGASA